MRMKIKQLVVALVATFVFALPVPARSQEKPVCDKKAALKEPSITAYLKQIKIDEQKAEDSNCSEIDLAFYTTMNPRVSKALHRHHCKWDQIPSLKNGVLSLENLGCLALTELPVDKRAVPPPTTPKAPEYNHWVAVVGGITAASGIGVFGYGIFQGMERDRLARQAEREPLQLSVLEHQRNGDRAASQANLMFGIGSALAAIGIAGVIVDLMYISSSDNTAEATVELSVVPNGANLTVTF